MTDTETYAFERIVKAAISGQKAPSTNEVPHHIKRRLQEIGAIKRINDGGVWIIEILIGPYAGRRTERFQR